jgi:hypothetical protein
MFSLLRSIVGTWYAAQAAADTSLSGTPTGEYDRCHLFRDALDETTRQADAIMMKMAEQLEALYQCRLQDNPTGTFDADGKAARMIQQVTYQGRLSIEAYKTTAIVLRQSQQQQAVTE